ncbi:MAG: hypothetical protein KDA67_16185 [Rhodobacteraceae bacterium]|nr:hypothetical protein [Paracoccaceae bacterium]
MCRLLNGVAAFTLLVAGSASAQSSLPLNYRSSSASGFYINGYTDLSYGRFPTGGTRTLLIGEVDMGVRPDGGGLGFSLGIDGFTFTSSSGDMGRVALYPALTFDTDFGRFSAGVPRSVLDRGYVAPLDFVGSRQFRLQFLQISGSATAFVYLFNHDQPVGIRYDASFGPTSIGASLHHIQSGVNVLAVAIRHEFQQIGSPYRFAAFAGFETGRSTGAGATNKTNYIVGVEGGTERLNAGLNFRRYDVPAGAGATTAYVEYIIRNVTLSAAVMGVNGGATQYGVGAEYRFNDNLHANLSITDNSAAGFNPMYELMVGWRF